MRLIPNARGVAAALVAAALALTLPGGSRDALAQHGPPPAPVRVDAVRSEKIAELRRVPGNVRAHERSRVATREAGTVLEIAVRDGERVKTGQVLCRLDSSRLDLELKVVRAEEAAAETLVAARREERDRAARDVSTLRDLVARAAANARELQDAETAAAVAESQVRNAESQVRVLEARAALLQRRIDDLTVRAPFDGVAVARLVSPGGWAGEGAAVAEIVSDALEAWLDVPQRHLGALSQGDPSVRLESEASDTVVTLTGSRALADVDPRTRTFPLVVPLPRKDGFAPGSSVTAWVPTTDVAEHMTVATDAILRSETGAYVYVAVPGAEGAPHTAMAVPVEVLFVRDGRAAVRSARLTAGALAIVEGNERLWPTAPVAPTASVSPPAAPPGGAAGDGSSPSGERK